MTLPGKFRYADNTSHKSLLFLATRKRQSSCNEGKKKKPFHLDLVLKIV